MPYKLPPLPWAPILKKKSDDFLRKLKPTKVATREKKARKISWKDVSRFKDRSKYEVAVSGKPIGTVEADIRHKWTMYPGFRHDDSYYTMAQLQTKYLDFREAGKAMVELWIIS